MEHYTPHQARYFAEQIALKRSEATVEGLASAISGVKVDLNPHQVDAALFAVKSPLGNGALLADEVGLGKTIEAGLVMAQYWSERKRHILLIVPASLRMQWRAELMEKFYIDSVILESTNFNKDKKNGKFNPFDINNAVVICSYNFAARKEHELSIVPWDLVVLDEAHKLRNVYKKSNVTGNKLKKALTGRKKLLLTATPLQNNLMELYGLTSIIDDHIFGDDKTFREMYVSVTNEAVRNSVLRKRLGNFCKRTLRKQVTEYVKYTNRIALLQEYSPTHDEELLYNDITEYLQTPKLYALPEGQRNLITMVLRKLLASSSFAIHATLESLISRLEGLLEGVERELDLDDYDAFDEYKDEDEDSESTEETETPKATPEAIKAELERLRGYAELAKSIRTNAKGDNLMSALEQGFNKVAELGGEKKAVIFTESKRTQDYIFNLLTNNGYEGRIVFLNGVNNDEVSKKIYNEWKERHKNDGMISGSRTADMKAAIVEEFRTNASILIGTEAAAEGINLQFCCIIVNYDLPWNPQRIEQRIGRCHRYGQKNDVVVINFLNRSNAADQRVYELLDQKFRLFSGVFGSSDEILGSVESGVDFEKRIAAIYQRCKDKDDIQREFDELQEELADQINSKMLEARRSILENFDEEVAARLKDCKTSTVASLNKFSQWMYYFFLIHGAQRVEPLDEMRFRLTRDDGSTVTYNLNWGDAEKEGDIFLRKEDDFFRGWLDEAISVPLDNNNIKFDNTNSPRRISFFDNHIGLKGVISVDKLAYSGIGDEEHLICTAITEDGTPLDDDLINNLFELPGEIDGNCPQESEELLRKRAERFEAQKLLIDNANKQYYLDECEKIDAYTEDLKEGLTREMKDLKKTITEKKRILRSSTDRPLAEIVEMKEEINKLESKCKKMQREIYDREDEIEAQSNRLQEDIRKRLEGDTTETNIMTFSFEIV